MPNDRPLPSAPIDSITIADRRHEVLVQLHAYMPHLDSLRAIAIGLVLIEHLMRWIVAVSWSPGNSSLISFTVQPPASFDDGLDRITHVPKRRRKTHLEPIAFQPERNRL